MSADALVFRNVVKAYGRGGPKALDDASFRFPRGRIVGLVGPNGAGKTTAFSVISGYLNPDEGEVDILGGGPFDPWRLKGRLGVLPQDAELSDRHTPRELIAHLGLLQGLGWRQAADEADRVLRVVRLDERMRRRVAVASALVGSPELVLLDEPTAGLDPVEARALREALAALRGIQTLVVSSHNLDELERLCDWVVMLRAGRCLREGTVAELTGQQQIVTWELGGTAPLERLRARLPDHRVELRERSLEIRVPTDADPDATALVVMEELVGARVPVREMRRGVSLEQRFFDDATDGARATGPT
jgi:ABC-2 type transport system ATP-binding protein